MKKSTYLKKEMKMQDFIIMENYVKEILQNAANNSNYVIRRPKDTVSMP